MDIPELKPESVNLLNFDKEQIKSLDFLSLRKILPLFEKKCKEGIVNHHLELLQNENKAQQQKLNALEVKKFELAKSIEKFRKIDTDLGTRENKVLKELKNAEVMCPIYQYKMNNFLDKLHSKNKVREYNQQNHWNQTPNELAQEKQKLEETIDANEKIIEKFVEKYLK